MIVHNSVFLSELYSRPQKDFYLNLRMHGTDITRCRDTYKIGWISIVNKTMRVLNVTGMMLWISVIEVWLGYCRVIGCLLSPRSWWFGYRCRDYLWPRRVVVGKSVKSLCCCLACSLPASSSSAEVSPCRLTRLTLRCVLPRYLNVVLQCLQTACFFSNITSSLWNPNLPNF